MKKTADVQAAQNKTLPLQLPPQRKNIYFWLCVLLISAAALAIMWNDLTRPFYGLHSWGQAHFAWLARAHVTYGLGYTKGFDTFAVGQPPTENPVRYLNHPILSTLLDAASMKILGINVWSLRVVHGLLTIAALIIFIRIVRHLYDPITALLAGLFFALFPITGYFGTYNTWLYPFAFASLWFYLVLIGAFKEPVPVKKFHKWALAACLFFALQVTWEGFFWAAAIGIHYIVRNIRRRRWPEKSLLLILIIAPLSSLLVDFVILASGGGWDFKRIFELARIRSTSGEMGNALTWTVWFGRFAEHALTNFTLPVILAALLGLTIGQIYAASKYKPAPQQGHKHRDQRETPAPTAYSLRISQFWLFFMPPFFQLVFLRGTLYPHQYWERPLVPLMAIAAALAVLFIFDILKKANTIFAFIGCSVLVILLGASCFYGLSYYFEIHWENPKRMEMFEYLNKKIPPDKALLSLEPLTIDQFPGVKAASYRPEIAWYLDREIVCNDNFIEIKPPNSAVINIPKFLADIDQKAKTGKYPFYLIPGVYYYKGVSVTNINDAINALAQRYKLDSSYELIPWKSKNVPWTDYAPWIYKLNPYQKQDTFYQKGMMPYFIFDLTSPRS